MNGVAADLIPCPPLWAQATDVDYSATGVLVNGVAQDLVPRATEPDCGRDTGRKQASTSERDGIAADQIIVASKPHAARAIGKRLAVCVGADMVAQHLVS